MCDKMAISAYILKIVEKDPFLRLQMRAKEMFNRHQFFLQISNMLSQSVKKIVRDLKKSKFKPGK